MIAICELCDKEYKTFKNWYERVKHHTCSKECAYELKKKLSIKICKYCGKDFYTKSHQRKRIFCSSSCAKLDSRRRIILVCEICNQNYEVSLFRKSTSRFCSDKCRTIYTGRLASKRIGKLNAQYKGFNDEKRTDKSKLKSWAIIIRRRDKSCQLCGSTTCLQAHHIVPYGENVELRFDINNGILLCNMCHAEQHKNDIKMVTQLIYNSNGNKKEELDIRCEQIY